MLNIYSFRMSQNSVFSQVDPGLEAEFQELCKLEPIFHTENFGTSAEELSRRMSSDYWEVGASGRRYSRAFILENAAKIALVNATSAGWKTSEIGLKQLGPQIFLLTYTLDQIGRLTRRATIWHKSKEGWSILYHQGTIISTDDDDLLPAQTSFYNNDYA